MIKIIVDYIRAESRTGIALRQDIKVYSWLCQIETYRSWWSLNTAMEKTPLLRSALPYVKSHVNLL